jgi:hypothetical protein
MTAGSATRGAFVVGRWCGEPPDAPRDSAKNPEIELSTASTPAVRLPERLQKVWMFRGEVIVFQGRSHAVVGVDPDGVMHQLVYLRDLVTSERLSVPAEEFVERSGQPRLRLILGGAFEQPV